MHDCTMKNNISFPPLAMNVIVILKSFWQMEFFFASSHAARLTLLISSWHVKMEREFTHMQIGPIGYPNKMCQLESIWQDTNDCLLRNIAFVFAFSLWNCKLSCNFFTSHWLTNTDRQNSANELRDIFLLLRYGGQSLLF